MQSFRESIDDELDRRDWTAYRLAQESGVSKTSVYEYLRGRREIETDALERLCAVLGLVLTPDGKTPAVRGGDEADRDD